MQINLKKYGVSACLIVFVFAAGFIAGCNKQQIANVSGKAAEHAKTVIPAAFAGVHTVPSVGSTEVAFSPEGGITPMVVKELGQAKKSIQVQAYSFTSQEIIQALIDAKKRGVDVKIIIDKSNVTDDDKESSRNKKEKELLNSIVANGIGLKVDSDFQIAHSKIMIIDGVDVITGSFNFTHSAEHNNAENCLVIHGNKDLAGLYTQNWQWRWNETENYKKS